VIGTSRSGWKLERAVELGLDVAIDTSKVDFAEALAKESDAAGIDVLLDLVGGPYLEGNLAALAPKGRMIVVGLTAGRKAEIDLGALLSKRLHVRGTSLRSRPLEEKIAAAQAFQREVIPLLRAGRVRPIVDEVYSLEDAAEAHRRMEANANFGKLVLTVG
jgi:NADPH:quinone reductase-like Zn-dependent oxidoreductase